MNRYNFIANCYSPHVNTLKELEQHAKGWNHFEWFNQWYRTKRKTRKLKEDYNRRMLYCKLILNSDL